MLLCLLAGPLRAATTRLQVVVKGQDKDAPSVAKPALDLLIDPYETIRQSIEPDDSLLLADPPALSIGAADRLPWLKSRQGAKPWNDASVIKLEDLRLRVRAEFKNKVEGGGIPDGSDAAGLAWTVSVIDEDGRVFRGFKGSGAPPETVSWDGRSDKGRWLAPGHDYSAVYLFSSAGSPERTFVGDPIRFKALLRRDAQGLLLSLDSAALFGSKRDQVQTVSEGAAFLLVAADLIRRTAYGSAVEVRVYGPDEGLARKQAESIRESLIPELSLPERMITAVAFDGPGSEYRVELLIKTSLR